MIESLLCIIFSNVAADFFFFTENHDIEESKDKIAKDTLLAPTGR